MKRNLGLIRDILLEFEKTDKGRLSLDSIQIEGHTDKEILFHIELMKEGDLLEQRIVRISAQARFDEGLRPTMQGYDLLDSIRDPEVWQKTKKGVTAAGSWTLGILKDLATAYAKAKIQEVTGVAL